MRLVIDGAVPEDQQIDVPSTWDDGSAALAICTFRGPAVPGESEHTFMLEEGSPPPPSETFHLAWNRIAPRTGLKLEITETSGEKFTLDIDPSQTWMLMLALAQGGADQQTRGVETWATPRSLRDHPRLKVRMRWRGFSDWRGMWLDVTVENSRTDAPLADVSIASGTLTVDGKPVASTGAYVHRAGARWTWSGWIGDAGPEVAVIPDGLEMALMNITPALDWSAPATPGDVIQYTASLSKPSKTDSLQQSRLPYVTRDGCVLGSFPLYRTQGDTGDRNDIGSITTWQAALLNGGTWEAWELVRAGDLNGSGAFQVHLRQLDNSMGLPHNHALLRQGNGNIDTSASPCRVDVAHHPLSGLLTWLFTGDERAAEELAAWACVSARNNYPNDGSLQQPGDRREAWALRTLSRAAVFLPDHFWAKQYSRTVLEKTANEFEAKLPAIVASNPLGSYQNGRFDPGGRKFSPCCFIASAWQAMWFIAEALRASELVGLPQLRPLAEHGWQWVRNFVLHPGDSTFRTATADAGTGFGYDSQPAIYEGIIDSKNQWAVKPGSVQQIKSPAEMAWYRRISGEREKWPLTSADLCGDPTLLQPKAGAWTPFPSEEYFEYSFGRVGLLELAVALDLPEAAAVRIEGIKLLASPKQRNGKHAWALQSLSV